MLAAMKIVKKKAKKMKLKKKIVAFFTAGAAANFSSRTIVDPKNRESLISSKITLSKITL
jgi:hypothetical protein